MTNIYRSLLKLPDAAFSTAFKSEEISLSNVHTLDIILLLGNKVEGESGSSAFTIDAIKDDGSIVSGVKFLKRLEGNRYQEVSCDAIDVASDNSTRQYRITARMLAKHNAGKVRINTTAVSGTKRNCTIIAEGSGARYTSHNKPDNFIDNELAPLTLISLIATVNGEDREITNNALTVVKNSVTSVIKALFNRPIFIKGTAKVIVEIAGAPHDYATVAIDETNPKRLIITPIGSNGTAGTAGEVTLYLNDDLEIYDQAGVKAEKAAITLTVIEGTE